MNEDCKHDRQVVTCQVCGRAVAEVWASDAFERLFWWMCVGTIAVGIIATLPLTLPLIAIGWAVETLATSVNSKRG